MARKSSSPSQPAAESLGIDALLPPDDDDQGLSLEELGQAYAALINQGADPYPQSELAGDADRAGAPEDLNADDEPPRVLPGSDDAACQITPQSILEAILFVGHPLGDALTSEKIASLMRGVMPAEIDDLVIELNEAYAAEGRPYTIESAGAGYQLVLRPQYAGLRDHFYGKVREARLSQTAIDVLAIVAYNQPVTHEEIDRIRGRESGSLLAQLVRRDLIAMERPAEKKSRPIYRTTDRFLDLYHLDSLDDLPQVEMS